MTTHRSTTEAIDALVGARCEDCYDAMRRILAAMGVESPATPEEALAGSREFAREVPFPPRRGDILVMRSPDRSVHVGVAISAFSFLHACEQSGWTITRGDTHRWIGRIIRIVRPIDLLAGGVS